RGGEPVLAGEVDVHQHHVGDQLPGLFHRFEPVGRAADDGEDGILAENRLDPPPRQRMIVHDEDAHLIHCLPLLHLDAGAPPRRCSRILAPLPGELSTETSAPINLARSCIIRMPKWPAEAAITSSTRKPRPSSSTSSSQPPSGVRRRSTRT